MTDRQTQAANADYVNNLIRQWNTSYQNANIGRRTLHKET